MIKSVVFDLKQTYVLILSQKRNWLKLGKSLYLSESQYPLPENAVVRL